MEYFTNSTDIGPDFPIPGAPAGQKVYSWMTVQTNDLVANQAYIANATGTFSGTLSPIALPTTAPVTPGATTAIFADFSSIGGLGTTPVSFYQVVNVLKQIGLIVR